MDGDASWDEDFEFSSPGEELSIPQALSAVSGKVQEEGVAARKLAKVISGLRDALTTNDERLSCLTDSNETNTVLQAVALVHASITEPTDAFYATAVWKRYKDSELAVDGATFELVLESAEACEAKIQQLLK